MIKNKVDILRKWISEADQVIEDDIIYKVLFSGTITLCAINNCDYPDIQLTNELLENSEFEDDTLVVKFPNNERYFTFQKVQDRTCPVELMDQKQLEYLFEDIASECDGEVYYGYSGRFMYGEKCFGITTDDPETCITEARNKGLTGEKTDNMGFSTIVYWPRIKCEKENVED